MKPHHPQQKNTRRYTWLLLGLLLSYLGASPVIAAEEQTAAPPPTTVEVQLPEVIVTATVEDPLSGSNSLTEAALETLPDKDGSLNEALAILPGVQLPDDYRDSTQGGEISPPEISISGGRPYDNLITLDGISVSSQLDPASNDKLGPNALPSASSALTLGKDIIDEITLYRYNIPARYGGFSGGVIDTTTRSPGGQLSAGLEYRTTQENWSEFFIDEDEQDDFYASRSASLQPEFRKHQLDLDLDIPLFSQTGLLGAYSLSRSEIPLLHFGETTEQTRQIDNFLVKLVQPFNNEDSFTLSTVYTRYDEDTFRKDTYASDLVYGSEGLVVAGETALFRDNFDFNLLTGFNYQQNLREAPQSYYSWDVTPSKPWGDDFGTSNSKEGGYGDLYRENTGIEILPSATHRFQTRATTHATQLGLQYTWDRASQERPEDVFTYFNSYDPINDPADPTMIDCSLDPNGCIDGEQQFKTRWIYPTAKSEVEVNQVAAYLEHLLEWKWLSLRPGLRYSTDDFQNNSNLAPRMVTSVDIFGNGNTLLIGGANRYYSETLLSYKLREYIEPTRMQTRSSTQPSAWPGLDVYTELNTTLTHYSDLKTPYSDEYAAAIDQYLLGGRLKLEYIRRDGQDEFSREKTDELPDGHKYYELNNNGRSEHEEVSLNYERRRKRWALLFNVTYQKTSTSNLDYDDSYDDETAEEKVWFEGEVISRWELPRESYNRPWTGNLVLSCKLPYGFTATTATRYLGHYQRLEKLDPQPAEMPVDAVESWEVVEKDDSWVTDWKIAWQMKTWQRQSLTLQLEINNVFNEKYQLSDEDSGYSLGRQFWAGLSYRL